MNDRIVYMARGNFRADSKRRTKIGKFLCLVLRHDPGRIGLDLDSAGWARVSDLIACVTQDRKTLTEGLLREVVRSDRKQRFALSEDGTKVRANQGHSIDVDLGLEPLGPPEFLYHGTATRFLSGIRQGGLDRRQRHHVHLSPDEPTAVRVGQRHGRPVILKIQSAAMACQGYVFMRSANGVWLTDHVPVEFIEFPE